MAKTKTDVEAVVKELLKLLRFATKTMKDPRLACTSLQPKYIFHGPHTMKYQW